ncbi:GFA family protein [Paroceanicella profunda]|nr:GFA family protein [Paroceanicella profunda]
MRHGHCLCGAVGFEWDGPPNWVGHCHCESCRRATGSPLTSFVGVPDSTWRWTGTAPARFASSPGVERLFCPTCGAPIAYRAERFPGETHFHLALVDDPAGLTPTAHFHWKERVRWLAHAEDGLARE